MRHLTLCSLAVVAAAGCAGRGPVAPEPGTTGRVFDLPYVQRELANGLRVIVVRTPYPDLVTLQIPVGTGSRNEVEPGKSGFAHFFEHMMFRGTEKVPGDRYTEILKAAGADSNAYTSDDLTNYHTTFLKEDLEQVLALEADRFQNLRYDEATFRTEALAVKGEYLKSSSDPGRKLFEVLRAMAFTTHPYRHTTLGFLEDIEDMPNQFAYSRLFFERWYRPGNTTVIVAGDVDPDATVRLVETHWGGWAPGAAAAVTIPAEPPPKGPAYRHVPWSAPAQPLIAIAFRGPAFDPRAKDLAALQLLADIHFSPSSELVQRVVHRERWADAIYTSFPERRDPSLLIVGARLNDAAHARKVADALIEALVRARTQRVTADRLAEVKSAAKYGLAARMDTSRGVGEVLARFAPFERSAETLSETFRTRAALTPDDLLAAANRAFVDAGRFTVSLAAADTLAGLESLPSLDLRVAELASRADTGLAQVQLPSESPLVDVAFLFHSGAAQDPPGKRGLAALTATLVATGGSAARTNRELSESYVPLAARLTVQTDKEMTRFAGTVHKDNLEAWYALAQEQLLTPGWREDDFRRVQQELINQVRTNLRANNDEELAKEVLYAALYGPQHPYGHYTGGALRDLATLTLADAQRFYARHYTPANLTLGLAGDYPTDFVRQFQADLARLPAGARATLTVPPPPPLRGRRATIVRKETSSVAVSFGFPIAVRRGDPDWIALWLARSWLGEHRTFNGRLQQRIRELRGMNYGNYAYEEYFPGGMFAVKPPPNVARQQQIFQVWLRPLRSNNDAVFATRTALFELQTLIEQGLTPAQFEATRGYLDKHVAQLTDTQARRLGYALDSRYYGIPAFSDYAREGLRRLTVDDVNRAIRKHLQTRDVQFVFVARDADDLRRRLVRGSPSPIEYNSPKPDDVLAEDRVLATWPLDLTLAAVTVRRLEDVFR